MRRELNMTGELYPPAEETLNNHQPPELPRPQADFSASELQKSFRGYLYGALNASEQLKVAAGNLGLYGANTKLTGNKEVIELATRRWEAALLTDVYADKQGRTIPSTIPMNKKVENLFNDTNLTGGALGRRKDITTRSLLDRISYAQRDQDLTTQKDCLEKLVEHVNFSKLKANIQSAQYYQIQEHQMRQDQQAERLGDLETYESGLDDGEFDRLDLR